MKNLVFRTLTADEIDVRASQVSERGVVMLLYKDARCDMTLLDETVGTMNWQKEYSRDNRNCKVSIWDDEKNQWISKEDTGTESNTEAEKGLASDSFKRACFNWGIGRELYTAPFVFIPAEKTKITTGKNGKPACYEKFTVSEISYDEKRRINHLVITNKAGTVVYSFGTTKAAAVMPAVNPNVEKVRAMLKEKKVDEKFVTDAYKVNTLEEVSDRALARLATTEGILKVWNSYVKQHFKESREPEEPDVPLPFK